MTIHSDVQKAFIDNAVKTGLNVVVYLGTGIKLDGRIVGFDDTCILLDGRDIVQLVFTNAISTILPTKK